MEFPSLAESPLNITDEELTSLFNPFVLKSFSADDPEWRLSLIHI